MKSFGLYLIKHVSIITVLLWKLSYGFLFSGAWRSYWYRRCNISIPGISVNPSVEIWAQTLQDGHRDLFLKLYAADKQYKAHTDRHCLVMLTFAVGDMVWLLRRHIATTHPYTKLDYKKLCPFYILERINPIAFRLALPPHFGFTMFSTSLSLNSTIIIAFWDENLWHRRRPWNYQLGRNMRFTGSSAHACID